MEPEYYVQPETPTSPPGEFTIGVAAMALLLYALWGGNPVATKFALTRLPPIGLAGMRFAIAAALLAAWCAYRREPLRPAGREARPLLFNGLLFTAQIATFYLGTWWSNASHSAVLVNAFPVFVAIFAHFWLAGDRLSAGKALGIALGFAGMAAVLFDRWGHHMLRGDLVLLVSALLLAAQNIYVKDIVARISPYRLMFWQMVICAVADLAYGLGFEQLLAARPTPAVWGALAYQAVIVGAFSFTAWAVLLRRAPVSKVSVFGFSTPLFGVILSHWFLGEPLTRLLALGMLMVAVGIGITLRS